MPPKYVVKAMLGLCLMTIAMSAAFAGTASAAFLKGKCGGASPIQGAGTFVQTRAHLMSGAWAALYKEEYCPGDGVQYWGTNSLTAHELFRERRFDLAAFAGTTGPPGTAPSLAGPESVAEIERHSWGLNDQWARLLVIPVTSTAIAVIVNTPTGCKVDNAVGGPIRPQRAAITKAEVEEIWRGDLSEWWQLTAFDSSDPQCHVPIHRVVRADISGTTSQFKLWLHTLNFTSIPFFSPEVPTFATWAWLARMSEINQVWPTPVIRPSQPGPMSMAQQVEKTDGSLGYVSLSDAIPTFWEKEGEGDIYWLALEAGPPAGPSNGYADPLSGALKSGVASNCGAAEYRNVDGSPVPITSFSQNADWSEVGGFNSNSGYPICSLTYVLAWYDGEDVEGGQGTITEARQRAVHDYLTFITTPSAEWPLAPKYYSPLPPAILKTAATGASMVCWAMPGEEETC